MLAHMKTRKHWSSALPLMGLSVALLLLSVHVLGVGLQEPQAGTTPPAGAPQDGAPRGAAPRGGGRGRGGARGTPLGDGPWDIGEGENLVHVTVVTKGLDHPWGMAILPNSDMLVTERAGRLRVVKKGVLDPNPIGGLPEIREKRAHSRRRHTFR
jgi:glucose/arabinose dehydrogenase